MIFLIEDSFLELSLHKHDSLGDLTKITRTFTSGELSYSNSCRTLVTSAWFGSHL